MRNMMCVLMLCLVAGPALAQSPAAEVDQKAILRLGDLVQHVGDGVRGDSDAIAQALAPPESDADKWFISVVTSRGCAPCETLKRDWQSNEWLLALANPNDPKQSWAHFNFYDRDDKSQQFRFENLRITSFPTILVQPPRTGRWGDPATIVFQGAYAGGPEKLARSITAAIRAYVAKQQATQPVSIAPVPSAPPGFGADPPWTPTPRVDPWSPSPPPAPQPTPFDPTIPPQPTVTPTPPTPTPSTTQSWIAIAWPLVAPAFVAGIAWLAYSYRAQRLAQGKQPIVDQQTLDQMLALLKKLAENAPQKPKA